MKINLTLTMDVPDKGVFSTKLVCETPLIFMGQWNKTWKRLSCVGQPDILGVHFYYKFVSRNIIALKFRLSNGAVNPDGTGFCGKTYFKSLVLSWDTDDRIVTTVRKDESVLPRQWIIAAATPNDNHVMLPRAILEREFCICAPQVVNEATVVLRRINLRIPDVVNHYGPLDMMMPVVNREAYSQLSLQAIGIIEASLQQGVEGYVADLLSIETPNLGPWHPEGNSAGYSFGGLNINPYTGFAQVPESVYMNSLLHIANMDRMPFACYNINTGEPIRAAEWTYNHLIHAELMKGEEGRESDVELIAFLDGNYNNYHYRVFNPGNTCSYEAALTAYRAHDPAHVRRMSINAEPLWHYEQNPMAGDDLIMAFEYICQCGWSDRNDEIVHQDDNHNPSYIYPSLMRTMYLVTLNPNDGINADRAFGWGLYHAALANVVKPGYSLAWLEKAMWVYVAAADSNGVVQKEFHQPFLPTGVEGTQSFHSAIIAFGASAAMRHIADATLAKATLLRFCDRFYNSQTMHLIPYTYGPNQFGPPHWVWTHVNGNPIVINNTNASVDGDIIHTLAVLGEAYRLTNNVSVIRTSLKHWTPAATIAERKNFFQNYPKLWQRAQIAGYESAVRLLK